MLKNRQDLINIRQIYANAIAAEKKRILVCGGTGCVSSGSLDVFDELKRLMEEKGLNCSVELEAEPHEESVGMKKSGCHGFCEMGPLVRIEPQGWLYTKVKVSDCQEIVDETIIGERLVERLAYQKQGVVYPKQEEIPFYQKQTRLVLEHCGHIDALSIKEYFGIGGYSAFEKALFEMTPDDIVNEITESNLRGRGGGGFPAGRKWSQVKRQKAEQKYVVCNGDEGDPGAFMDRSIMEGDPHRMLEGMMIAGLACGATEGYIYVRAEYPLAVNRLQTAIDQAMEYGILGDHILGTDFSFHFHRIKGTLLISHNRIKNFTSPGSYQANQADNFTPSYRNIYSVYNILPVIMRMFNSQIPDRKDFFSQLDILLWIHFINLPVNHRFYDSINCQAGSFLGPDMTSIPHHADPVCQLHNLLHFMADIDTGNSSLFQLCQNFKQSLYLSFCQRAGRLVQNQNFRIF